MKYLLLLAICFCFGCGNSDSDRESIYSSKEIMQVWANGYYSGIRQTQHIAHETGHPYQAGDKIGCIIDYDNLDSAFRIDSILTRHKWFDK